MSEQTKVDLRADDGATAEVHLQGAHVTSWRPAPGDVERLFLSERSEFREGAAIRGGIPVIFPQFATEGPLPRHGFARTSAWTLGDVEHEADGDAVAWFNLPDSPATRAIWPASFLATIGVRVGGNRLIVTLTVENTGGVEISFTAALHTYHRVHDLHDAEVVGLHGGHYRDSSAPGELKFDRAESIRVEGEIDRVYVDAPRRLTLREPLRAMLIEAIDFPDVVVWNPGAERAAGLKDMKPEEARQMLCVEAAAVHAPVVLGAGRRWSASQLLTAVAREVEPPSVSARTR